MEEWLEKLADHLDSKGYKDEASYLKKAVAVRKEIEEFEKANPMPGTNNIVLKVIISIVIAALSSLR